MEEYDIVLIDDQSMTVPDQILAHIDVPNSGCNGMETTMEHKIPMLSVNENAENQNTAGAIAKWLQMRAVSFMDANSHH